MLTIYENSDYLGFTYLVLFYFMEIVKNRLFQGEKILLYLR